MFYRFYHRVSILVILELALEADKMIEMITLRSVSILVILELALEVSLPELIERCNRVSILVILELALEERKRSA